MELVVGRTLRHELHERGALETGRAIEILIQLAEALDCAHRAGIVHRDLKPENLMLTEHRGKADVLKVLDFGLAKILDRKLPGGSVLSVQGEVYGSPPYMSPEQIEGRDIEFAQTDIYSFGASWPTS